MHYDYTEFVEVKTAFTGGQDGGGGVGFIPHTSVSINELP